MTRPGGVLLLRLALGVVGGAALAQGMRLLLDLGLPDLVAAVVWLGGGVVAHDALLAPLVLVAGYVGGRALPSYARGPAAAATLVLGTLTLAVLPVLGRFGAKPDDPYLLDRPYLRAWMVLAATLVLSAVAGSLVGRRRKRRRT